MNKKYAELADWESYEALEMCIGRDSDPISKRLRLSQALIIKWKEPRAGSDNDYSGARNPLDRVAEIISVIEKIDVERAYIPLHWLCARFGFLPPIKAPKINECTDADLFAAVLNWNKEAGDVFSTISLALKDGRVSLSELKASERDMNEAIAKGLELMICMKTRIGK